jgi:hypothetical protein
MASSQEKYQLILEAREAAAEKIKKLNAQINALGGPAMVKSQREVNKLERELKLLNQSTDKGHPIFSRFTSGIAIGTIAANAAMRAFSAFTGFIKGTFQAALESNKVWGDVSASLDRHRGAVDVNIESVKKFAGEMQTLTGISDELVGTAFQRLHDSNIGVADSMNLTRSAMDMAAARGMDVAEVASLIGKSINSSTNALGRYGIQIDKSLPKQEQMRQVQEKLNQLYGGAAAARMLTTAGKLELLKQRMGDLQEAIGGIILQSPAFEYFLELVSDAAAYWGGFVAAGNLEGVRGQIASVTTELEEQKRIAKEYSELPWYEKLVTTGGYAVDHVEELKSRLIDLQHQEQVLSDQASKNIAREQAERSAAMAERFAALKEMTLPAPMLIDEEQAALAATQLYERLRAGIQETAITEGALIPIESILPPTPDMDVALGNLNTQIKAQINSDIISRQQGQFAAAFTQIGKQGIHNLAAAMASGQGKISDVFKQMYQSFMTLFIEQCLLAIGGPLIKGIVGFLGGMFDTPSNDRMLIRQGQHAAHYFSQGFLGSLQTGSEFMRGIVPSASNLAMPAMAAPAPAASGGSTINITFSGNVLSSEFIERQVAPTLRKLVTNGKSDLALSAENVTGGRNIRVY